MADEFTLKRIAPRIKRSRRVRFRLPYSFSEWVDSDAKKMVFPPEFTEVYLDSVYPNQARFKHLPSGSEWQIWIVYDADNDESFINNTRFLDLISFLQIGVAPVRLDFTYYGDGEFTFSVWKDPDEATWWNSPRADVESRFR